MTYTHDRIVEFEQEISGRRHTLGNHGSSKGTERAGNARRRDNMGNPRLASMVMNNSMTLETSPISGFFHLEGHVAKSQTVGAAGTLSMPHRTSFLCWDMIKFEHDPYINTYRMLMNKTRPRIEKRQRIERYRIYNLNYKGMRENRGRRGPHEWRGSASEYECVGLDSDVL